MKQILSNQNDFELDYTQYLLLLFQDCHFLSKRFQINLILNFVFILPAQTLFISLCFPDFTVFLKIEDKNNVRKNPKWENKRVNEEQRI